MKDLMPEKGFHRRRNPHPFLIRFPPPHSRSQWATGEAIPKSFWVPKDEFSPFQGKRGGTGKHNNEGKK